MAGTIPRDTCATMLFRAALLEARTVREIAIVTAGYYAGMGWTKEAEEALKSAKRFARTAAE